MSVVLELLFFIGFRVVIYREVSKISKVGGVKNNEIMNSRGLSPSFGSNFKRT